MQRSIGGESSIGILKFFRQRRPNLTVDGSLSSVIAFMLTSAEKPFADRKRRKMVDKIMRADYTMTGPVWDKISTEGKDFVSNLLIVDPKERLNATGEYRCCSARDRAEEALSASRKD